MKNIILRSFTMLGILSSLFISCKKTNQLETLVQVDNVDTMGKENGQLIPGQYIVVLKESLINNQALKTFSYQQKEEIVLLEMKKLLTENGIPNVAIEITYQEAINGFMAKLTDNDLLLLKKDTRVEYIEQDRIIALGKPGGGGTTQPNQTTPYGIIRVGTGDGTGKVAWIIDTGIDIDHPDLKVDIVRSKSFLTTGKNYLSPKDENGHGTHVSGTIAAKNNTIGVVGVAAGATVVSVRVLDARGSGTTSGVIKGVDYVAANANAGDVANMSLGGGISTTLDNAVLNAAGKGIFFAIAAGNESTSANNSSPARINGPNVYTVSAMDINDNWAYFSNFGNPPVDLCAPGVSIYSTWKNGTYNTISGTSMATPHVAGILLMTGGNPSTSGTVINDPDGNPDLIAHL